MIVYMIKASIPIIVKPAPMITVVVTMLSIMPTPKIMAAIAAMICKHMKIVFMMLSNIAYWSYQS